MNQEQSKYTSNAGRKALSPSGRRKPTNLTFDPDLKEALRNYCLDNRTSMSDFINDEMRQKMIAEGYLLPRKPHKVREPVQEG